MQLHPAIETYFDADRREAVDDLTAVFATDAKVTDEGRTYAGREAIGAWWSETKALYRTTLTPLDAAPAGATTVVRATVSGAFPGSPVVLSFAFRLEDGLIHALEITA
jgi:hypothetical protein